MELRLINFICHTCDYDYTHSVTLYFKSLNSNMVFNLFYVFTPFFFDKRRTSCFGLGNLYVLFSVNYTSRSYFFTFLLHLFLTKEGPVVLDCGIFMFYLGGIIQGAIISLRFLLLILMTSLLTLTTTPIEITDAVEALLNPLKKVKFPVHELALMM